MLQIVASNYGTRVFDRMTDRSLRKLSPDFVIPAGTQVVLKVDRETSGGDFRKAGSVAIVVKCPPHNNEPYLLEFADGTSARAMFAELTLRRQEIDTLLQRQDENLRRLVIYKCHVGSTVFGLATDHSDVDLRGIYLPPADRHWSLYRLPEQIEFNSNGNDEVYWEIEKFVRLALKANPNILETLWTPLVVLETAVSRELREIRDSFLSRHLYKTYSGYVISQFRRMKNSHERTGKYKTKHAMHLLRLLYSGIEALRDGQIMIDVSEHRDQLMKVRDGAFSFEEVRKIALQLDKEFQEAFAKTSLPEQPDFERVDQFLVDTRRRALDEGNQ